MEFCFFKQKKVEKKLKNKSKVLIAHSLQYTQAHKKFLRSSNEETWGQKTNIK